jgi:hypothetical protein
MDVFQKEICGQNPELPCARGTEDCGIVADSFLNKRISTGETAAKKPDNLVFGNWRGRFPWHEERESPGGLSKSSL